MKKSFIAAALLAGSLYAGQTKGVETLSDGLRGLLSMEMLQIEKGMHKIFSHMVRGEFQQVNKIALNIRDSFILKKRLSKSQKAELRTKLPNSFLELDQSFHETAGDLANAAEFGDKDTVVEYYQKMVGKCVQCHSKFAAHRFENFED